MVNPFRCKPIHKKAIFAVLTDDELQQLFNRRGAGRDRAPTSPGRAACAEGTTHARRARRIDLPAFIRENRDRLVMKPNDEYGGKGVFIGWEMTRRGMGGGAAPRRCVPPTSCRRRSSCCASVPRARSPTLGFRDLVVDLDPFVFEGEVEGFLTRLSGTSLANVTSGGGQVPAFLVEPRG